VDNGADIISNSWGSSSYSQALEDAANYAYSQGVIVIAAAGNKNLSSKYYPAGYQNVVGVGATNSDDDKASFSNYGNWVDLAAPGEDILSLRASGTSMGAPHDTYTTVASGTSMACPHVAGVCALLLSVNPYMGPDDARDILIETVDVVFDPGICLSNGRLNVHKALLGAVPSKGYVSLDREGYNCSCQVGISLADCDIAGAGTQDVSVSCGSDSETVTLTETSSSSGVFAGQIWTSSGGANSGDGILQVYHDGDIFVTYQDADDGSGNPAIVMDGALVDCVSPTISDVDVTILGQDVTVSFETDEYT
jgi:subtilisin family serine protease